MVTPNVHEIARDFRLKSDRIERECDQLAADLLAGRIDEAEFDRRARGILGSDYEPPTR